MDILKPITDQDLQRKIEKVEEKTQNSTNVHKSNHPSLRSQKNTNNLKRKNDRWCF